MYKTAELLDRLSGYFALGGFVTSKLQIVPIPLLSAILRYTAFSFYLMSYGLWLISSIIAPRHPRKINKWYGYADFKTQNTIGAVLGFVGVTLGLIAALFFPPVLILGSWLIVLSNIVWAISEYHKYRNPSPEDPFFVPEKHSEYMKYVLILTLISAVSATAFTICILFPPASLVVMTISTITGLCLTGAALHYWAEMTFKFPPWTEHPKPAVNSTVTVMQELRETFTRENIQAHIPTCCSKGFKFFSSPDVYDRRAPEPNEESESLTTELDDAHLSLRNS